MCRNVTDTAAGRELTTDFKQCFTFKCKASCCFKCSYCARAFPKERNKSRDSRLSLHKLYIKVCEKCFLCHSIVLCSTCNKCQKCCLKSACRGQTSKLSANLAGSGCRSENSSNPEGGLHPPFSDPAKSHKVSHSRKLLCQSPQEQLPDGGITSAYRQKCCRISAQSDLPRVFQPAVFGTQTQQQVETNTGPEQSEPLSQGGEIQNGDTGNHQDIPPTRGVGHLNRFQGRLLPHSNTGTIQEIPEIFHPRPDIPIQSTTFRSVHSTLGVHCSSKGGETDGHAQGYKNPPVPRRLVGEGQIPPGLSPTYSGPSKNVPRPRLAGECRKVGAGAQASLRLCRLPVRPQVWSSPTDTGPVAKPSRENKSTFVTTGLSGPAVHVLDRFVNSYRETSSLRPTAYEAHTVASQKQLESTRISKQDDSNTQVSAPTLTMVAGGKQCAPRSTIAPLTTRSANFHRCVKRRVGRSLKRAHCKRVLVSARKQTAHKLSRTKSSVSSFKRIPRPLCGQNSSSGHRQYNSSGLHKQRRRHEVGPTVCPTVENLDLVYPATSNSKSLTHPRPTKCGSRQTIPAGSDHPDGMVPPSRGFSGAMPQMAPTSDRPLRHEVQPQIASVCVSSTRSPGCSSGFTHSAMGGSGCLCLPTGGHIGQSGGEVTGLPVQENHPDCSGVAQHALVLVLVTMSSQVPISLPILPNLLTQPFSQIPHRNLANLNLHAWLLEPQQSRSRVSLRQWREELRLLKGDQPEQSMRQSGPFSQSGASLIRWTSGHPL